MLAVRVLVALGIVVATAHAQPPNNQAAQGARLFDEGRARSLRRASSSIAHPGRS